MFKKTDEGSYIDGATTNVTTKSKNKPNIAMFIDVENVGISRENLLEVLFYINGKYHIQTCRLYGYDEETLPGIKEIAGEYNLVIVNKMQFRPAGQNCLDARLLLDAYECAVKNAPNLDTIFVWSYPCDLSNLFEKIIQLGISTATIDNPAFDCKNKFVSETIKLYSKYNFTMENPMYGNTRTKSTNEMPAREVTPSPSASTTATPQPPVQTAPEIKPEAPKPVPQPKPETNPSVTPTNVPAQDASAAIDQDATLDGAPIPVLPKRIIPERTGKAPGQNNPADTNAPAEELDDGLQLNPGESLVDAISRNLNLEKPDPNKSFDEISEERDNEHKELDDGVSLVNIMNNIGLFGNDNEKEKKYEDTIGDL